LATKSVYNASEGRGLAFADEVEIEHALNSSWLHAAAHFVRNGIVLASGSVLDEASCLLMEQSVRGRRTQRATRRSKASDIVVGRESSSRGSVGGSIGAVGGRDGERHFGSSE
jgi:hypothetical protein